MATKTYTVKLERDRDGWWVATVDGLAGCHTQGRSIAQAKERIREALDLFDAPRSARLEFHVHVDPSLDAKVKAARAKREAAELATKDAAEATEKAVASLVKAGLSRRDVGELVGVSFQRVQQLAK